MAEALALAIAGEPMRAFADRALYWPARRRLLIADLHLGKGDVFRAAGLPLPSGGTAGDLARLSRLLAACDADELWVLGDLLHGDPRHGRWREAWDAWRDAHPDLRIAALRGNHDSRRDAAGLDIDLLGNSEADGPFLLRHDPLPDDGGTSDATPHVICGHLHPALRLPGLRALPAFWLRDAITVLPAFSAFTGAYALTPADGGRFLVCAGDALVAVGNSMSPGP
ncbi:MAG: ligase-associated DNA damage response endonuclease PdeM [Lysobacteraceae bacterium]